MSAIYSSIDEMLKNAKDEHETTLGQLKDQIFALQTELALHKRLTAAATADRDKYMRLATKLITQFDTVEKVFSDAKALALSYNHESDHDSKDHSTTLPANISYIGTDQGSGGAVGTTITGRDSGPPQDQ